MTRRPLRGPPGHGHRRRRLPRSRRRRAAAADAAPTRGLRPAQRRLRPARRATAIDRALADGRPDVVIHLAAVVGGIGANRENPGRFFYENAIMGIQLMEQARLAGRGEVRHDRDRLLLPQVHAGAVPRGRPLGRLPGGDQRPLRPGQEDAPGPGPGVPRAVRLQRHPPDPGQPLRPGRQLRPGQLARHPGADQEVRRRARARRRPTSRSGAPAAASREFLYVDDAAEGIVLAAERYDGAEPVNLGVGREITIRDLVELIVRADRLRRRDPLGRDQARRAAAPGARHDPRPRAVRLRGADARSRRGCGGRSTGTKPARRDSGQAGADGTPPLAPSVRR